FACPAAGWAAGGTPMPAPDDPPGAFATKSSKPSHGTTPAPSPPNETGPKPDDPVVGSSAAPVATKPRAVVRSATATPSPAGAPRSRPTPPTRAGTHATTA